jgi:hypothetical protein
MAFFVPTVAHNGALVEQRKMKPINKYARTIRKFSSPISLGAPAEKSPAIPRHHVQLHSEQKSLQQMPRGALIRNAARQQLYRSS